MTAQRDRRVRDWAAIVGVAILSLLVAYLFYDRQVRVQQLNAMSTALAKQRQQAVQAGQTPVAPPPAQILATPTAIAGPRGDTGAQGPAGRGLSSIICVSGVWHVAYTDGTVDGSAGVCTGPPGPIGATGQSITGSTGPQGPAGPAGKDGQSIVGPTGPAGPVGPSGAAGTNGQDGKPPASWTWTSTLGVKYVCTRDSGSPDASPSYACAPA